MKNIKTAKHVNTILLADDDADDRLLVKEALIDADFSYNNLSFVENGQELMDYLQGKGQFSGINHAPLPDLILLDLNMPKKDGREALKEIKTNPHFRHIPVIVLTTSTAPADIRESYDIGANTYFAKPVTFEGLVATIQSIKTYWIENALVS